jgi:hypothetical protein
MRGPFAFFFNLFIRELPPIPPSPLLHPGIVDRPYAAPSEGFFLVPLGTSIMVGDGPTLEKCAWYVEAYKTELMEHSRTIPGGYVIYDYPKGCYSIWDLTRLVAFKVYGIEVWKHYAYWLKREMQALKAWDTGVLNSYYGNDPDGFWNQIKAILAPITGDIGDWRN